MPEVSILGINELPVAVKTKDEEECWISFNVFLRREQLQKNVACGMQLCEAVVQQNAPRLFLTSSQFSSFQRNLNSKKDNTVFLY